ncbi:MAG TPA: hypothetical protein ENN47_02940 [Mesotoga infera]|uniref:Uncharacterized protein n=1 Tax=Mesotoga infera TaxID=1236046 RepID=A0A7C1GS82_9BACT|nr:hypothetical protein [Mesotoga infera]
MKRIVSISTVVTMACIVIAFMGSFGGERTEELFDVASASDGFLLIGFSEYYDEPYIETLVLKTDFDGRILWAKEYGTPADDIGRCIAIADDGSALLVSRVEAGGNAKLVARLVDEQGNLVWQNSYGKHSNYSPWRAVYAGDAFVIAGQCMTDKKYLQASLLKIDLEGRLLWERDFGGEGFDGAMDVIETSDHNLLSTGYSWIEDHEFLWVALLDPKGKTLWQKEIGKADSLNLEGRAAAEIDDGYLIAGIASDFSGVGYIVRLDLAGELIDETRFSDRFPAALSVLKDDGEYISLLSYVTVSEEGFGLARIGDRGKILDERFFEIASFEPHSFARLSSGKFLVVGTLSDEDFGRQAFWMSAEF